jgi:PEGA domain
MKVFGEFAFAIALLTSCTLFAESKSQNATLYVVNDSKGTGFALRPLTLKLLMDNQELASVRNHQVAKLSISPGDHGFALKIARKDVTVLHVKPGATYFMRVMVDQGFAYAATRCVLMSADEASYWIPEANQFRKEAKKPTSETATSSSRSVVNISSNPTGAEIILDGSFAGNTPSSLNVAPGDHAIVLKLAGYQTWERQIKLTEGTITVSSHLIPSGGQFPAETSPDTQSLGDAARAVRTRKDASPH